MRRVERYHPHIRAVIKTSAVRTALTSLRRLLKNEPRGLDPQSEAMLVLDAIVGVSDVSKATPQQARDNVMVAAG